MKSKLFAIFLFMFLVFNVYQATSSAILETENGLISASSNCNAQSESDSASCSCVCESAENDDLDQINNVYIITAKNKNNLDKLLKKMSKEEDCRDAEQLSVIRNLMFAATYQMSIDCVEEVVDWGYTIEQNALQIPEEVDEPWLRDRIDQRDLPLDNTFLGTSGGEGVTIFILDTGVRTDHIDLFPRATLYKDILDPTINLNVLPPEMQDEHGHGTRCASAAIGETLGVATKANVLSIRVAGRTGKGTVEQSLKGFNEVKMWTEENPGKKCVVSYSHVTLGTSISIDNGIIELSKSCVVVVVAGNYGSSEETADACKYSPARVKEAITVGASRLRKNSTEDDRAGFSSYGECVDLYAPGHKVDLASHVHKDAFVIASGTSFAAPAVAGAAAVLLGNGYDVSEVKELIVNSATPDKLVNLGGDPSNLLLNVQNAIFHNLKN